MDLLKILAIYAVDLRSLVLQDLDFRFDYTEQGQKERT